MGELESAIRDFSIDRALADNPQLLANRGNVILQGERRALRTSRRGCQRPNTRPRTACCMTGRGRAAVRQARRLCKRPRRSRTVADSTNRGKGKLNPISVGRALRPTAPRGSPRRRPGRSRGDGRSPAPEAGQGAADTQPRPRLRRPSWTKSRRKRPSSRNWND